MNTDFDREGTKNEENTEKKRHREYLPAPDLVTDDLADRAAVSGDILVHPYGRCYYFL